MDNISLSFQIYNLILKITGIDIWKQKTIGRRRQDNHPQPAHTVPPPAEATFLITETGNFLITENSNFLITE